jgi:hypothetical protein
MFAFFVNVRVHGTVNLSCHVSKYEIPYSPALALHCQGKFSVLARTGLVREETVFK